MTVKICVKCGQEKSLEYFCKGKNYKDGRRGTCKKCHTEYQKKYYRDNEDKRQAKNKMNTKYVPSWKRHHISEDIFNSMMKKYEGLCHACKEKEIKVIDHDHSCCESNRSCGKCVRGLLCQPCNIALGLLLDNRNNIIKLLNYIDSSI